MIAVHYYAPIAAGVIAAIFGLVAFANGSLVGGLIAVGGVATAIVRWRAMRAELLEIAEYAEPEVAPEPDLDADADGNDPDPSGIAEPRTHR